MTTADDTAERLAGAALATVEETGWRSLSLAAVAARAEVPLLAAYETFRSKADLLAWLMGAADRAVLADGLAGADDPPRDRLFEILMRRFDALQQRRAGLVALLRDLPSDPLPALCVAPRFAQSIAWMLEAAGLPAKGPLGALRIKGVAIIYITTLRTWITDDSADMARTMKALDTGLRRLAALIGRLPSPLRRAMLGEETPRFGGAAGSTASAASSAAETPQSAADR